MSAPQELFNGSIYLVKVCFLHGLTGNDDYVPTVGYHCLAEPGCFSDETSGTVTYDRPSQPSAHRETKAAITQMIG